MVINKIRILNNISNDNSNGRKIPFCLLSDSTLISVKFQNIEMFNEIKVKPGRIDLIISTYLTSVEKLKTLITKDLLKNIIECGCYRYSRDLLVNDLDLVFEYLKYNILNVDVDLNNYIFIKKHMLTPQEVVVLNLIWDGYDTENISKYLKTSYSTIETHRRNIKKSLKSYNLVDSVRLGVDLGYINPNTPSVHNESFNYTRGQRGY